MTVTLLPLVGLDLDDTLVPMVATVAAAAEAHYGIRLDLATRRYTSLRTEIADATGLDRALVAAWMADYLESTAYYAADPMPGAFDALTRLAPYFRFAAVTARDPSQRRATRAWLDRHFPGLIPAVHFTGKTDATFRETGNWYGDKTEVLLRLGAAWMIDDRPDHLTPLAGTPVRGMLFGTYPWTDKALLPLGGLHASDWDTVARQLLALAA